MIDDDGEERASLPVGHVRLAVEPSTVGSTDGSGPSGRSWRSGGD
jgi:hypothetical protein